jgi:hypothetical protein
MRLGGREKGFNQPGCAGLVELVEISRGSRGGQAVLQDSAINVNYGAFVST